jgi:hypothetical protein
MSDIPSRMEASGLEIDQLNIIDTPVTSHWIVFPMAQAPIEANPHLYVNGRFVSNNTFNLRLTVPDSAKAYTLRTMYRYNAVVGISGGDAQIFF